MIILYLKQVLAIFMLIDMVSLGNNLPVVIYLYFPQFCMGFIFKYVTARKKQKRREGRQTSFDKYL